MFLINDIPQLKFVFYKYFHNACSNMYTATNQNHITFSGSLIYFATDRAHVITYI